MFLCATDVSFEDKMLWAAVLRRAVFDYALYNGSGVHAIEWKHAFRYIFRPCVKYENGYTFDEVCGMFGWDPDYLRRLTTRLTKADVKKLEVSQIREEFTFDMVEAVVVHTGKWKGSNFATPFLPFIEYSNDYREKMEPKVIRKEQYLGKTIPMIQCQASV